MLSHTVFISHPGHMLDFYELHVLKNECLTIEEWTTCLHGILFFHLARVGMAGQRDCCMQGKRKKKRKTGLNACPIHIHTTVAWVTSRASRAAGLMNPRWIYALFSAQVNPLATFEWLHLPFPLLTAGSALILPTGRRWISATGPVWHCHWNKRLEPLSCFIHFNLALSTTNYNSWHHTASWQKPKINTAPWLSTSEMHSNIRRCGWRSRQEGMNDFTMINQARTAEQFSEISNGPITLYIAI